VRVYADWADLNGPRLMGLLAMDRVRGKEIFSFEYDGGWLSGGCAQLLDPDSSVYGQTVPSGRQANFGIFLDSSPDRWGRLLMRRREACCARHERRAEER
jgi:serine/threonine-protein kinase HipA